MKKFKITKKKIIIFAIILIIGSIIFINNTNNQEDIEQYEMEEIEKRTVAKTVSATGVINSTNTKNVISTLTGSEILSVNVKKGDKINVGDIICTFDTSNIQENLNIAQATQNTSQTQANIGLQSAQRSLNDAIENKNTQVSSSQEDVNSAKSAYDNAVNQLNSINASLNEKQNLKNQLEPTYQQNFKNYSAIKLEYDAKELAFNQATNNYNAKIAEINSITPDDNRFQNIGAMEQEATQLKVVLNTAESEYLKTKSVYDGISASFLPIQNQYNALVSEIAGLQSQKSTIDSTVSQLKSTYDKMVTAYNATISSADSAIASMKDNVENSKLAVESNSLAGATQINAYKEQIENGIVKSTVDGTVTNINVKKGDLYTGTTIATIEGTEEFIIEAEIDEYDIPDVEVGMKVLIKTDATRDEELEGRITYVATSATNSSNELTGMSAITSSNATYKIEISLDSQNDRLRLGMNAKLSIITEIEENVWTVPYNAIYEKDDGTHYIEIAKDETGENKEELEVEIGIEGTYYTQIKSEKIKDGMKIVLPKVESGNSIESLIEMMGADAGI